MSAISRIWIYTKSKEIVKIYRRIRSEKALQEAQAQQKSRTQRRAEVKRPAMFKSSFQEEIKKAQEQAEMRKL